MKAGKKAPTPTPKPEDRTTETVPDEPPISPTPKPKADSAPVVVADKSLAGHWQGAYQDSSHADEDAVVNVTLHEADNKRLAGTMDFTTRDKATGKVDQQGSCPVSEDMKDDVPKGVFRLLIGHCDNPNAPKYFHFPTTFSNVSPDTKRLPGGTLFLHQTVTASLSKTGS